MSDLPYSERPEWKDVTPIKQNDGPLPLVSIRYPPGFEEVHDYFRAVQFANEYTERALALTADVIEHNSANYTAWYYRRWLIAELLAQFEAEGGEDAKSRSQELGRSELEYHMDVMTVNDDFKNYNGWSHRQFVVQRFGLWDCEIKFCEGLLSDDIRNNSAWNHRYTVVRHSQWPLTDETRSREITYVTNAIRRCANNESAWNYLAAFFGEGEGCRPWDSSPLLETLCFDVLAEAQEKETSCRFANETLARIFEAKGEKTKAEEQYRILKDVDKIRANYWDWRIALLRSDAGKAAGKGDGLSKGSGYEQVQQPPAQKCMG